MTTFKLTLERRYPLAAYTIGKLSLQGKAFCDTLEDTDRRLTDAMDAGVIAENKLYGQTAIPKGTYKIEMGVVSPKFKDREWAQKWGGKLPRLKGVKGFDGVLIHVGNTAADTLGCILVGENKAKGKVLNSSATFDRLMAELVAAWYRGEDIEITIR